MLRASSESHEEVVDLNALMQGDVDSGITFGAELVAFAEAIVSRDSSAIEKARNQLLATVQPLFRTKAAAATNGDETVFHRSNYAGVGSRRFSPSTGRTSPSPSRPTTATTDPLQPVESIAGTSAIRSNDLIVPAGVWALALTKTARAVPVSPPEDDSEHSGENHKTRVGLAATYFILKSESYVQSWLMNVHGEKAYNSGRQRRPKRKRDNTPATTDATAVAAARPREGNVGSDGERPRFRRPRFW